MTAQTSSTKRIPYVTANDEQRDFPTHSRQLAERLDAIIPADGKILINGQLYNFTGVIRNFPRPRLELRNGHYAASVNVKHPFTPPSGYKFTYTAEESSGFTFVSRGSETLTETTIRILQVANGDNNALSALRYYLVPA